MVDVLDVLAEAEAGRLMPTAQIARADDVVDDERAPAHLADAGDDRHDRAHERDEAREQHGLRALPLEELVRPLLVLGLEEPGAGLEQPRAEALADLVADLGAGDGARRTHPTDDRRVRCRSYLLSVGGEEPGGEEERVAGQRRREHARLQEDDDEQARQPERVDQVLRVEEVHGGDVSGGAGSRRRRHDRGPWSIAARDDDRAVRMATVTDPGGREATVRDPSRRRRTGVTDGRPERGKQWPNRSSSWSHRRRAKTIAGFLGADYT